MTTLNVALATGSATWINHIIQHPHIHENYLPTSTCIQVYIRIFELTIYIIVQLLLVLRNKLITLLNIDPWKLSAYIRLSKYILVFELTSYITMHLLRTGKSTSMKNWLRTYIHVIYPC